MESQLFSLALFQPPAISCHPSRWLALLFSIPSLVYLWTLCHLSYCLPEMCLKTCTLAYTTLLTLYQHISFFLAGSFPTFSLFQKRLITVIPQTDISLLWFSDLKFLETLNRKVKSQFTHTTVRISTTSAQCFTVSEKKISLLWIQMNPLHKSGPVPWLTFSVCHVSVPWIWVSSERPRQMDLSGGQWCCVMTCMSLSAFWWSMCICHRWACIHHHGE